MGLLLGWALLQNLKYHNLAIEKREYKKGRDPPLAFQAALFTFVPE
jgi:hypothetical protein